MPYEWDRGVSLHGLSGSNWHYEGPKGPGGHNLRRPDRGTRLNQIKGYDSSRDYNLTWKTGDKIGRGDIWTNNVARAAGGQRHHPFSHAYEVLDWGAYNRDPLYKQAAKALNFKKGKYRTLDDIHKAEAWLAGEATSGRRHRNELAELQAQLDREKALRDEADRMRNSMTPQPIVQTAPTLTPAAPAPNPAHAAAIANLQSQLTAAQGQLNTAQGQHTQAQGQIASLTSANQAFQATQAQQQALGSFTGTTPGGTSAIMPGGTLRGPAPVTSSAGFNRAGMRITNLNL